MGYFHNSNVCLIMLMLCGMEVGGSQKWWLAMQEVQVWNMVLFLQVGHGQFDPEVYKANAMANIHNRTQSRARNFVGSGNILSYNK